MKKSMFLLGIAAAALASCTNEEVVEVAQNRVIGFSTFVNNGTRAVSEVTNDNLTSFYVFGDYGSESSWTRVFNNTQVNGGKVGDNSIWTPVLTAYWQPSQSYLFGAYSNGNANTTAAFDAATNALTFSSYDVVSNQKDLIAALGNYTTDTDVSNEDPVNLEFDHMLSQVKFTFTNTDSEVCSFSYAYKEPLLVTDYGEKKKLSDIFYYLSNGNQVVLSQTPDITMEQFHSLTGLKFEEMNDS